jgi:hypothetical protein
VVLALALPGGVSAWWMAPRPAEPAEMPPLVVPQADVDRALAEIASLAGRAPEEDDAERARRELYVASGHAEARADDPPGAARARSEELARMGAALAESGAIDAVRARDVERGIAALRDGDGSVDERTGEIGAFPVLLERYRVVVEGRRVAPAIVLHALFWARWNAVHRRDLVEGMSDTLRLAYHGWLAFYGPTGGTELRDGALVEYVRVGGRRGIETQGFLLLSRGDVPGAQLAFQAAYEATGSLRLRNHALALSLRDSGDALDEAGGEGVAEPAAAGGS